MMTMRRGFSLVEILVATSIFALVSVAMIGIYATATDLVRLGEARRSAADEAMATIAILDADLARIAPPEAGGFFLAQWADPGWDTGGSMALAFTISDPTAVMSRSMEDRPLRLVLWMTDQDLRLWRVDSPAPIPGQRFNRVREWFQVLAAQRSSAEFTSHHGTFQPIAQGCALFSVDVAGIAGATGAQPAGSSLWCTESGTGTPTSAFPPALRLTVGFARVGAHEGQGRLVPVGSDRFRISGLKSVAAGQWLRIKAPDNKVTWMTARPVGQGIFAVPTDDPHAWRTTEVLTDLTVWPGRNAEVLAPSLYSVTRSLGR